jgi:hypothetical protein
MSELIFVGLFLGIVVIVYVPHWRTRRTIRQLEESQQRYIEAFRRLDSAAMERERLLQERLERRLR